MGSLRRAESLIDSGLPRASLRKAKGRNIMIDFEANLGAWVAEGSRVPVRAILECGRYGALISAITFCAFMNSSMAAQQYQSHPAEITSKEFFQMEDSLKSKTFANTYFQGILTGLWWYESQMRGKQDDLFCPPPFPLIRDQAMAMTRSYIEKNFAWDWDIGLMTLETLKEAFPCRK
jgi:hypothetical protein